LEKVFKGTVVTLVKYHIFLLNVVFVKLQATLAAIPLATDLLAAAIFPPAA
jgi:hypothetical protein